MTPSKDVLDPIAQAELDALEAALHGDARDAEWTALVAAVRDEPPSRRLQDAQMLDARVSAGFPRTRPGWLRVPALPGWLAPGLALASVVLVLVGVVGLAALAGGGGDDETTAASSAATASTASEPAAEPASGGDSAERAPSAADEVAPSAASGTAAAQSTAPLLRDLAPPAASTAPLPVPAPTARSASGDLRRDRRVERSTTLALRTSAAKLQETSSGIVRATQDLGGVVETSQVDSSPTGGTSSFVLRVPTARLDEALKRFGELADVRRLSQAAQDITGTVVSAQDRLTDARAERRALLRALGSATTDRSVASLRTRLRENRATIARREGDVRSLRNRTDTARIDVTLRAADAAATDRDDGGAWGPGDAARDALRVLEVVAGGLLVAAAVLLPFALVGGAAVLAGGLVRRRRREGALA